MYPEKNKVSILKLTLFILLLTFAVKAQNLIPNPSFETAAWLNANSGSVDWNTGPTNVFGTENARTGTRYMGESMGRSPAGGSTDFREYIKNSLTTALIPGNTYECSIWVSLSENYGSYACNNIAFATTTFNPTYAFNNAPIPLTPVYTSPTVMTNKVGWTQVFGTFVATAADTWVTIGNFNTQLGTTWTYVGPATGFYYGYYFLDDACLGPPGACGIILPIELLSFEGKAENKSVKLNWKTATELNCDYFLIERSNNGKTFETIGKVKGHGTSYTEENYIFTDETPVLGQVNYYRLREYDFNNKSFYSNMVAIEAVNDLNIFLKSFPVPAKNAVTIELNADNSNSTLLIYNSQGELVYENNFSGYTKTEIINLKPGNYAAVLNSALGKTITNKFIVTE